MTSDFASHPVPIPARLATRDLRSFRRSRIGQVCSLLFAALLLGSGVGDASAQILSLEGGYRARTSGPSYGFRPPAGPLVGIRVAPVRFGWLSLGTEVFWSPRVTDVLIPEYCTYYLPTRECVKRLDTVSESAIQAGLSVRVGQLRRPRGFFGEIGLGGFRLTQGGKREFWASSDADHGARWHRNKLIAADNRRDYSEVGPYARIGVGYQIRLREGGPTALTSLRYRWATTFGEGSYKRNGFELLLGLGLF